MTDTNQSTDAEKAADTSSAGAPAERGFETGSVRVSVIVAVFNPGPGFDDLIRSLDQQTLSPQEFEVILCDDGSDDGSTRDRLRQVASTRPNVRVLTLEHTGWPGTPRNHGIEAARGKYVFFSDQDDRLFEGALEHLCDYADRHSSDVVVGKVVGVGRRIPGKIFRRDIPQAVLGKDPLLELLTPHKLFRSSFLRENGIRFPDGKVRLEDHLFVMRAYFNAKTISILASRPCYAWLKNEGSASSSRIDPDSYFPHLETVLDLVEANTEPGKVRDTLLRHWYRGKILQRLGGTRMVGYPDEYRERFLDIVTPIVQERFGPDVENGLALPLRIRSALLRADRRDLLLRFAQFEADLECRADVTAARWTRDGKLRLTVRVRILHDGEEALVFDRHPETGAAGGEAGPKGSVWRPPADLGTFEPRLLGADRDLRGDQIELFLGDQAGGGERRIPGRAAKDLASARLTVDPLSIFSRKDRSNGGPLVVHVRHAGWTFDAALRADPAIVDDLGRSPAQAGRSCQLVVQPDGSVELRREWPAGRLKDLAARAMRRARRTVRKIAARKKSRMK